MESNESLANLDQTKQSDFDPFRHGFKAFGNESMTKLKDEEKTLILKNNEKPDLKSSPRVPEISQFVRAKKSENKEENITTKTKKPEKKQMEAMTPLSMKQFDLSAPTPKVSAEKESEIFKFDKSSARLSVQRLDNSSYSRNDETIVLEDLGKSRSEEGDKFFEGI